MSLRFYLCYSYEHTYHRQLCFKEWREKQRDGVPGDEFDEHWSDLSPTAKKVRAVRAARTISSNAFLSRSEIQGPGIGAGTSPIIAPVTSLVDATHSQDSSSSKRDVRSVSGRVGERSGGS